MSGAIGAVSGSGLPCASSPSDGPACSSSDENERNAQRILQPGAGTFTLLQDVSQAVASFSTASRAPPAGSTAASSAARQSEVVLLVNEQGCCLVDGGYRTLALAARVERVVVETLCQQDGVGEAEINGESDDGGYEIGPQSTGEVCDITGHPY